MKKIHFREAYLETSKLVDEIDLPEWFNYLDVSEQKKCLSDLFRTSIYGVKTLDFSELKFKLLKWEDIANRQMGRSVFKELIKEKKVVTKAILVTQDELDQIFGGFDKK